IVTAAPFPAAPSSSETRDILKNGQPVESDGTWDSLPPIQTDRSQNSQFDVADEIIIDTPVNWDRPPRGQPESDSPRTPTPVSDHLWEPYQGSYGFWMRSRPGGEFGPCRFNDVLLTLRSSIPEATKASLEISGDGRRWMSVARFISLSD